MREIDEHWSLVDVLDANEALDVMHDAQSDEPAAPTGDGSLFVNVSGARE